MFKRRHIAVLSAVLLCMAVAVWAEDTVYYPVYELEDIPSPKVQGQDFYVSNPDGILSEDSVNEINHMLSIVDQTTEVEVAVVAIGRFDEMRYDAHTFALELFNQWGIGSKERNTGVLVFLATESRDVQIITGLGIEGILPDATCGEILDNNLEALRYDDYNEGIYGICRDISEIVTDDKNRSELLLGWKPKDPDEGSDTRMYLYTGFLLLIVFSFLAYKRLNGKPGQLKEEIEAQSKDLQTSAGCLSFLFPLPILLFYLYYRNARKHIQDVPLRCQSCGHEMDLLPDTPTPVSVEERDALLDKKQLKEEELGAYKYDIWRCPECQTTQIRQREGKAYMKFDMCPDCQARTLETVDRNVKENSTYSKAGLQVNTLVCQYCGHKEYKDIILPKKQHTSSSGSSRSSGSWGGSSSRSGGGSWGGGFSAGGGAGRKF